MQKFARPGGVNGVIDNRHLSSVRVGKRTKPKLSEQNQSHRVLTSLLGNVLFPAGCIEQKPQLRTNIHRMQIALCKHFSLSRATFSCVASAAIRVIKT